jgi:nucleotide-binding universal stress UspA family protein
MTAETSPQVDGAQETEKPSQRLVVGFDALGESTASLEKALEFACLIPGCHVEIVWVPPAAYVPDGPFANTPLTEILRSRVRQVLEHFGTELLFAARVTINAVVGEGRPTQALSRIAFMHDADLIVVGSHEAATSLQDYLLGSVPKRLVEEAPCPVLVVRPRAVDALPEIEKPRANGPRRVVGLPHKYHYVDRNTRAQENMPLLFPMESR